ncbi:MAG: hypothetical protein DRQ47_07525, partial [Gammaproteobacteria bacterium]
TMEHSMTVKYEAVKYGRGKVADGIPGFGPEAPQRYDINPSPLSKPGSTASILGQAGLLDTGAGAWEDLSQGNILGAVKKIGSQYKSFKNSDLSFSEIVKSDVIQEAGVQLPKVMNNLSKSAGSLFPKAGQDTTPTTVSTPTKPHPYYIVHK